jgi:RNA polymerase sigma factor (sigma-70 family)
MRTISTKNTKKSWADRALPDHYQRKAEDSRSQGSGVMAAAQPDILLRYIRKLRAAYGSEQLSDRELLRRFAESNDQAAFELLMRRHGPMVLRLCRRILPQVQDAEDVFQATFLVLARQAASRHWQESVGNWLYGVAYRLAQGAKREAARRSRHEHQVGNRDFPDPVSEITLRETLLLLDEELNHLPERYRAAMVLCYLEGKTRDEAAKQLGWSLGTLKRRLEEGRKRLHDRLVHRGATFCSALAAASLGQGDCPAAALMKSALTAAGANATHKAATGLVSKQVAALAEGALRTMMFAKLQIAAAMLLAVGVLTAGSGWLTWKGRSEPHLPSAGQGAEASQKQADLQPAKDLAGDDLPLGVLARMGTVRLHQGGPVLSVAFSKDGKWIVSGGGDFRAGYRDFTASLWDAATGKELRRFSGHWSRIYAVAISPDGKTVTTGSEDRTIRLWDAATAQELHRLKIQNRGKINGVAFSPDGQTLASAGWGQSIRLWDVATGEERLPIPGHHGYVGVVAFTADGQTLATSGADQTIRFWDAKTGTLKRQFFGGQARAKAVAFAPDCKLVARGDLQGRIHLLDAASGREIRQFGQHGRSLVRWKPQNERTVMSLAFSPDGKRLASCGVDGTVRVWETATGKALHEFQAHKDEVTSVAISPDGRLLASGSDDRTARLWDLSTGTELHTLPDHGHEIGTVAFSPDSRMLAANNPSAPSIVLWEVASGQECCRFFGHRGAIVSLCFSPDGRRLASGSADGTAMVWSVSGRRKDARLLSAQLHPGELESLWADLGGSDAAKAYQALWTLAASPDQAVPFVKKRLHPAAGADKKQLARLIRELDDDRFAVREKARVDLEKLGEFAEPALRKLLAQKPSLEVRFRAERLLGRLQVHTLYEESPQTLRAVELLERIGTPEARQVLEGLAKGGEGARLTQEAQASLERLAR